RVERAWVKCLKIKEMGRRGGPQPERVYGFAAVAHYGPIERHPDQTRWPVGDGAQHSSAHFEGAVQFDFDTLLRAGDLPRVLAPEPVVRLLPLPTVLNELFEDAVFVSQTVAHGGELHRGHRLEEACC